MSKNNHTSLICFPLRETVAIKLGVKIMLQTSKRIDGDLEEEYLG